MIGSIGKFSLPDPFGSAEPPSLLANRSLLANPNSLANPGAPQQAGPDAAAAATRSPDGQPGPLDHRSRPESFAERLSQQPSTPSQGDPPSDPPSDSGGHLSHPLSDRGAQPRDELREQFTEFVGQTFFGSVLSSMRETVGKPAYMHGGRGEEVFQQQLDQTMVQELTKASADQFADPMFDLFQMQRLQ